MKLTLPWAVLVPDNARLVPQKGTRRLVKTNRYREALEAAHTVATAQWKHPPLDVDVFVRMDFWVPDHRRRDLSNLLKLILDALQGVAYMDDKQVTSLSYLKQGWDPDNPRCEVQVVPR